MTDPDDSVKAVEQFSGGVTTSNQRENGSCRRSTSTVCVQSSIQLNPDQIDRVEGRTADGEVVVEKTANETEVYLELAELSQGETGNYTVHFIRDGESIAHGSIDVDCRTG
ncbi:hypothetical protein [Halorussus pelagicus]|uniref:hypothetical protein n=1 Tax=Halorussus pelagicus TaxID=2505977 RepID=UPI000FFC8A57|nr:hypothetical protein [Halorussus pelagicus]